MKPRRESQRPLLPQHARHCPVLEAGSSLGFLVYPPIESHESFHVECQGEGRYRFVYYLNRAGKWESVFAVVFALPVGAIGTFKEEVMFMPGVPTTSREVVLHAVRGLIVPEDLGTPAGAVTLRGAWNFQTPPGWDTVYTPVFNAIERPVSPMLVIRVETDWYAHESEFRYVLERGDRLSVDSSMPIGQVFFVPREPVVLRDCSEAELAAIHRSQEEFSREKAALTLTTSYGMTYSPHYLRKSRSLNTSAGTGAPEITTPTEQHPGRPSAQAPTLGGLQKSAAEVATLASDPTARKIGRNEACPCGSGKKYKKCHGAGP